MRCAQDAGLSDFPLVQLVKDMRVCRARYLVLDDEVTKKPLETNYGNCHDAMAFGVPYDARRTPNAHFHVDHIIPRAALR